MRRPSHPADAMARIAAAYPDTMLYGSDSPFYCWMSRFTNPAGETRVMQLKCDTDAEIEAFRKLSNALRKRVGYDNTMQFLFG